MKAEVSPSSAGFVLEGNFGAGQRLYRAGLQQLSMGSPGREIWWQAALNSHRYRKQHNINRYGEHSEGKGEAELSRSI